MDRIEALKPTICAEVKTMDESLEIIFNTMKRQGDISEAVEFLRSVDIQYIPSKTVLGAIVFEILMVYEDARTLSKVSAYLSTILKVFPPTDDKIRAFYYDFIQHSHGVIVDLWSVVCRIIDSYLVHHKIYIFEKDEKNREEDIRYPNCKFLLEFYIELFAVDFEYSVKSGSVSLIENLLWPTGNSTSDWYSSRRVPDLLRYINDIYQCPSINQKGDLLKPLHELVTLMVKCVIHKNNLSEVTALNSPALAKMADFFARYCSNACQDKNLKLFLTLLPLKCLRAKLCEGIINTVLKQTTKQTGTLTLKDIVSVYMYPQKCNKGKAPKTAASRGKPPRRRSSDKKLETTKLHELCKKNRFADLIVALKNSYDLLNVRDQQGATPLLIACQENHDLCVEMLITESGKDLGTKLDYTAADFDGITPLHASVKKNSVDIATLLLDAGGSSLLHSVDRFGHRPQDLCTSEEMRNVLSSFETSYDDAESIIDQLQETPLLKVYKDYSMYLHALNCLLCSYCDIYNLYNIRQTVPLDHKQRTCYHFTEGDTCSEDLALLRELPDIVETFIQSVSRNASKMKFIIGIEIIPLKAFAASLKSFS